MKLIPVVSLLPVLLLADTAGRFFWAGNPASCPWDDATTWSTTADHAFPNLAGDNARIGPSAELVLGQDITVGTLNLTNKTTIVSDGTVRTLTLDSGSPTTAATITGCSINWQSDKDSYIGTKPVDNTLVLALASPLNVTLQNNSTQPKLVVPAKVTGGSAAAPLDITFRWSNSWGNGVLFLTNPDNDFRGDLHITRGGNRDGDYASVSCGMDGSPFNDSMLGDPDNKVWLHANTASYTDLFLGLHGCKSTTPLNRHVLGSGAVRGFNNFLTWTQTAPVYLGPDCVIDPGQSTSDLATIQLDGSLLATDPATTFRLTLGTVMNDSVKITTSGAASFTGVLEFDYETSASDIAGGTAFTIMNVTASSFTFNPASTPAGYTYTVEGAANVGWTVTATKSATTALGQALAASDIGDTFATANAMAVMPESGPVATTLRVYYGTTDQNDDADAWDHYADIPGTVNDETPVGCQLTGLALGGTYYYRVAATSDGVTKFSTSAASFTTRPLTTNDTFTWTTNAGSWHDDNWSITTPYARKIPGIAGDTIRFDLDLGTATLILTNDVSVGFIDIKIDSNYGTRALFKAFNDPVTMTFDPGTLDDTCTIMGKTHHSGLEFGNTDRTNSLTVALAAPLVLDIPSNTYEGLKVYFYAPLTGGTAESPTPIYLNHCGNEWRSLQLYLDNEANSFVGDIYVGTTNSASKVKGSSYLYVCRGSSRTDAVLGPANNRVVLRNRSFLTYTYSRGNTCNRWIVGDGTVRASRYETDSPSSSQIYPLAISSLARIEPCSADETGFGTISFVATTLTVDPLTTFTLDLDPDSSACDSLAFSATAPFTLQGNVRLQGYDGAELHAGDRWAIATVAASATEFTNNIAVPGFLIETEGNATDGWTVYATKRDPATVMFIR